jgi:hypothetical protein
MAPNAQEIQSQPAAVCCTSHKVKPHERICEGLTFVKSYGLIRSGGMDLKGWCRQDSPDLRIGERRPQIMIDMIVTVPDGVVVVSPGGYPPS